VPLRAVSRCALSRRAAVTKTPRQTHKTVTPRFFSLVTLVPSCEVLWY